MNIGYIALGSNMDCPLQQVTRAVTEIAQLGEIRAISPWYRSKAIGPGQQDDYINGVLCLATELTPYALLGKLQTIEKQHQRIRTVHWGPRTLDLDILLFNETRLDDPNLTIPHPRMLERNFVLFPLADIAPDLLLQEAKTILEMCGRLSGDGLVKLGQNQ